MPYAPIIGDKNTSITSIEMGSYFIIVEVNTSSKFLFTYNSAGGVIVERMKKISKDLNMLTHYLAIQKPKYEMAY